MFLTIDRLAEPYRLSIENGYNQFVRDLFGGNHFYEQMVMNVLISVVLYWTVGLMLMVVDVTETPKFLLRYRVQPTTQVHNENLGKLVRQVLINNVISVVVAFFLIGFKIRYINHQPHVPTLSRFLLEWMVFSVAREILFYYSHRLLHHSSIYKYIHKRHHEWQTPIAITATYCHPIEHIVSNIIPVLIGPALMHSHNLTIYLWIIYVLLVTLNSHSGYHFPLFLSPIFHDFHHLKFNCNYGILGILDWFHGTDKMFRSSPYYNQHKIYFSLNPPKSTLSFTNGKPKSKSK